MEKVKIRCATCGKTFKTAQAKKTICPDCEAVARRGAAVRSSTPSSAPAPRPAMDIDIKAAFRAATTRSGIFAAYEQVTSPIVAPPHSKEPLPPTRPALPSRAATMRPRPVLRPSPPPRPAPVAKTPKPPTPPYQPTPTDIEAIRQRYLDLAQPEFDGIRHQIASDLHIPLRVVREIVKAVRTETRQPSWWDLQVQTLTPEDRARVRALYLPQLDLPLPTLGVHRQIAADLQLPSLAVYASIRTIREELGLPVYNQRSDRPMASIDSHDTVESSGQPDQQAP